MKKKIRQKALDLGFSSCGFTNALPLEEEKSHLKKWLNEGYHASMKWMEGNLEKRTAPALLHEGTKSIIVVTMNYYPEKLQRVDSPQIAKYAYGKDYHDDMRSKLRDLLAFIHTITPCDGRAFVDSAPVLERALAEKAGLGWRGKNSLLITKNGSYFLIGELFVNIELSADSSHSRSYCGNCRACIDACPTVAITADGVVDSSKCLSYLTIEHKGELPADTDLHNNVFGCDICQDVCPWNKRAKPHSNPHFIPHKDLTSLSRKEFQDLSRVQFNDIFRKSAVKRTKYDGFMRNIALLP